MADAGVKHEPTPVERWVAYHAGLFGFTADEAICSAGWEAALAASPVQLKAATDAIALDPGATLGKSDARFAGKLLAHLDALQAQLRRLRSIEAAAEPYQFASERFGTCEKCGSSGWVEVPHRRTVRDGKWLPTCFTRSGLGSYYTEAVVCTCALGRWVKEHNTRSVPTLEQYTDGNPTWPSQLSARRREEEAMRAARTAARDQDAKAAGSVVAAAQAGARPKPVGGPPLRLFEEREL